MPTPGPQIDVQTGIPHLVATPVVGFARQDIVEEPGPSSQFIPGHPDERLGGPGRKIHDDEVALLVLDPAPGENIPAAPVVGPAAFLAEAPFAVAKDITMDLLQQASVEGREVLIDRLCRAAGEKDRQPHLPSLELPLVQQPGPGEREDRHGRSAPFSVRKRGSGPRLVMVLDEPDHPLLVGKIRQEVQTHVLGSPVFHPVVEFLVVAEVEALLLQLPLQVPVGLGDELELRPLRLDRRDERRPVVVGRPCSGPRAPGALEDRVQHEHGHVAADAVALPGDLRDRLDHRLPEPRLKGVELEHIGPRREEGVPAAGKHLSARLDEGRRIVPRVVGVPLDEVFRVIADPGVVRSDVVGHEIEDEPHAALCERFPGCCEPLRTAEVPIDDVAAHAVGRADIVLRREVGKGAAEVLEEPLVSHGDLDPGGAPLPDAHEPDGVKAVSGDGIPLLRRNRGEIHRPLVFPAQISQPDPGVDLVDDRVLGP